MSEHEPESISIKLTWSGTLQIYLAAFANGTGEGRMSAQIELGRMARCADHMMEVLEKLGMDPAVYRPDVIDALAELVSVLDAALEESNDLSEETGERLRQLVSKCKSTTTENAQ